MLIDDWIMQNRVSIAKKAAVPESLFVLPTMPPMVGLLLATTRSHSLAHTMPSPFRSQLPLLPNRPGRRLSFPCRSQFHIYSSSVQKWTSCLTRSTLDSRRMSAALVLKNQVKCRRCFT